MIGRRIIVAIAIFNVLGSPGSVVQRIGSMRSTPYRFLYTTLAQSTFKYWLSRQLE